MITTSLVSRPRNEAIDDGSVVKILVRLPEFSNINFDQLVSWNRLHPTRSVEFLRSHH